MILQYSGDYMYQLPVWYNSSAFFPRGVFISHVFTANPLNAELNPICYFLALLGAHHILHVSKVRVKQRLIQFNNCSTRCDLFSLLYFCRPLGRTRRRWLDNIRMDLQEVGCGYVDWIGLAQDRDRWRTLVSAVMNLRVP